MLKRLTGTKPAWMGVGLTLIIASVWILWSVDTLAASLAPLVDSMVLGVEEAVGWAVACVAGASGVALFRWSIRKDETET